MKAIEWVRYLQNERACNGKNVFTVTELANVAGATPAVMNVELGRLVARGVIRRWVPGRYGLPDGVTPEELAAAIDPDSYVTGAWALWKRGFVTQVPREIECFTRRRHNRSRRRDTALGSLVFVCVGDRIHAPPLEGESVPAGQALCDLVFLSRRQGIDPRSLWTFRNLGQLVIPAAILDRYPRTVRNAAEAIVSAEAPPATRRRPRRSGESSPLLTRVPSSAGQQG